MIKRCLDPPPLKVTVVRFVFFFCGWSWVFWGVFFSILLRFFPFENSIDFSIEFFMGFWSLFDRQNGSKIVPERCPDAIFFRRGWKCENRRQYDTFDGFSCPELGLKSMKNSTKFAAKGDAKKTLFFDRFFIDFGAPFGTSKKSFLLKKKFGGLRGGQKSSRQRSRTRDFWVSPVFIVWGLSRGPFGDSLGAVWGPFGDRFRNPCVEIYPFYGTSFESTTFYFSRRSKLHPRPGGMREAIK